MRLPASYVGKRGFTLLGPSEWRSQKGMLSNREGRASPPHTEETQEPLSPGFKSNVPLQFPEVRICPVTTDVIFYQRLFQTDT